MTDIKGFKAESFDTDVSDANDVSNVSITIDWVKEKTILERKRWITIMMIVLVFVVTAAMMAMSVIHVEKNSTPYTCVESGCRKLLCQLQARTGRHSDRYCDELAEHLIQSPDLQHRHDTLAD